MQCSDLICFDLVKASQTSSTTPDCADVIRWAAILARRPLADAHPIAQHEAGAHCKYENHCIKSPPRFRAAPTHAPESGDACCTLPGPRRRRETGRTRAGRALRARRQRAKSGTQSVHEGRAGHGEGMAIMGWRSAPPSGRAWARHGTDCRQRLQAHHPPSRHGIACRERIRKIACNRWSS
jgi:hypothetical protein